MIFRRCLFSVQPHISCFGTKLSDKWFLLRRPEYLEIRKIAFLEEIYLIGQNIIGKNNVTQEKKFSAFYGQVCIYPFEWPEVCSLV